MLGINSILWAQQPLIYSDPFAFGMNVLSTLIYGVVGIALAIVGFKLFDLFTPGKLDEEIIQKQNLAAAILGGAVVLGICIIVAVCVHG